MTELRDKRILVTGGGGFLGRHVLAGLERRGCEGVVAPRRAGCDLTVEAQVGALFAEARPQVVIHLAAVVGGIGANLANPGRFLYDNLVMGALTMEYARRSGVEKFVTAGTVCSYPKHTPVPFREDDLWNGYPEETNAPYGLAKKILLAQGQAYRAQYGFNAIYLIPANLYGPGDNFDLETGHVIPALIRKFLDAREGARRGEGCRVVLWGDGTPTREFLYVEDCAEAIVLAVERYDGPEPVNIGTGQEISIRELAQRIAALTGFDGESVWDTTRPNGQPRRWLDTTRAWERFGFRARTPLDEGLRRTVEWYVQERARQAGGARA